MASFTNFATLIYNGGTSNSNTVTGELLETLTLTKTAASSRYTARDNVTYVLSLVNGGTAPLTELALTDNLGGYAFGTDTVYPLTYNEGTLRASCQRKSLQTTPTVTAGPPDRPSPVSPSPPEAMRCWCTRPLLPAMRRWIRRPPSPTRPPSPAVVWRRP